jgi:hypothetical protein
MDTSKLKSLRRWLDKIWALAIEALKLPPCPYCGAQLMPTFLLGETVWYCAGACGPFYGPHLAQILDGSDRREVGRTSESKDDDGRERLLHAVLVWAATSVTSLILAAGIFFMLTSLMSPAIKALSAMRIVV